MTQEKSTQKLSALTGLIETVHRLRAPGGCPWDRAQTHQSLRQYLIEEAYEVLDVLDQVNSVEDLKNDSVKLPFREELGDLMMQVLLHSEMTAEVGAFDIYDVSQALNDKLIRRHPHVFGELKADSESAALQNWEKEKAKEKAGKIDASILDGVPRGLPSLQKASRILEKLTKVGFQWKDLEGPLGKVQEEWDELKVEIQDLEKLQKSLNQKKDATSNEKSADDSATAERELRKRVEAEMGDVLFTLCNLSYLLKINPEDALRSTLRRFESRFRYVERGLKEAGKTPDQSNLEEMDRYWDEAKKIEKCKIWGLTGNIAAGKSTVAQLFQDLGVPVVDADAISREITEKNEKAKAALTEKFGTHDRNQLREIAFNDPQAKQDLEKILHPLIRYESQKQIQKLAKNQPAVIYEATLLIEAGRQNEFEGVILVDAPEELREQRLLSRPGMSPDMAQKIIASQMPAEEKAKSATVVITNDGSMEDLKEQVKKLYKKIFLS